MRSLVLVWITVLLAPLAWGFSLVTMFWATHPVCQGRTFTWIYGSGGMCVALALGGGLVAWRALRNAKEPGSPRVFLLQMATGASAIFALVIGLSLVPVSMLTPCPV